MIDFKTTFEKYEDEYLKFDRIESPVNGRPDLCAFIMLDTLAPGKSDIVSGAEHDKIWLFVEMDVLAEVITGEQIRDLVRCGIMYDDEFKALSMFT